MSIRERDSKEIPGSDLANKLQRQIDVETIAAGLNNELITPQESRLRAVVTARKTFTKIPLKELEQAINVLETAATKHCAHEEVAKINAWKKKFLILIYPVELKKTKQIPEYKELQPDQQSEWAHTRAWGRAQIRIQKRFGSPAPAEWSWEAHQWAHKYNR